MSAPWLHVIGIGEAGVASLSPAARALVESAEVIVGGDRHHVLSPGARAERISWPSPFNALIDTLKAHRGRRIVVLATGDPLWYSVGARIGRALPPGEVVFHPQISAFQLVACRMGWSLADVETLTAHGRPAEQVVPFFAPGARLLILTRDGAAPAEIAALLNARGYGPSEITVLAHLGGPREAVFGGRAQGWPQDHSGRAPDFHTLAVECRAAPGAALTPRVPGLPDDVFTHDGKITKREVRAATLAKLAPVRGELLWDVGAGAGSIGIEWMRAARDARAVGIEPRADRRALAAANALNLGVPRLQLIEGEAPAALAGLPAPDAVFIGGGLSAATFQACWAGLKPHGRLVANAVTLESETALLALYAAHGGELIRIAVQRAAPVGALHGWRPLMPVTQWSLNKP